jgi:hypothetical protein
MTVLGVIRITEELTQSGTCSLSLGAPFPRWSIGKGFGWKLAMFVVQVEQASNGRISTESL